MGPRTSAGMGLSLAVHALLALAPGVPASRRPPEPDALEVAVNVAPADVAPAPGAPDAPPAEERAPVSTTVRRRAARTQAVSPPTSPSAPAQPPLSEAARGALDPRAVARAALDGAPPTAEPRDADAGAAAALNRAIMAGVRSHVDTIPDPVLKRGPKGGYVYEGKGFDAIIRPDGSVDMRDRFGSVHIPLVPFQTPSGEWRVALLGGTFRLFEWLDKKFKNDPYRSERRWFLDRTRALREKLELEHYGPRPPRAFAREPDESPPGETGAVDSGAR